MTQSIVQIIPGAPPAVNGVGDFAITVAKELRSKWGINTSFLLCNPTWEGPTELDGFKLVPMPSRSSDELYSALCRLAVSHPAAVLLQLSPYGFDVNGVPFWLLAGLRRWKQVDPSKHILLTYCHELYAMSMPWRRAFWVSPLQRICARKIALNSDLALTNTKHYALILARWYGRDEGAINSIPVVSNVGEPANIADLHKRSRRLVIWGSAVGKRAIYTRHLQTLEKAVRTIGIDRIADIGETWKDCPRVVCGKSIETMGIMPPERISEVLADGLLAAFTYDPNYLAKSTIFAAFCAHGVPALCLPARKVDPEEWDGLKHEVHFITEVPTGNKDVMAKLKQVATQARDWYSAHCSVEHARVIAQHVLTNARHVP